MKIKGERIKERRAAIIMTTDQSMSCQTMPLQRFHSSSKRRSLLSSQQPLAPAAETPSARDEAARSNSTTTSMQSTNPQESP
jgi:hypothetical protein